jgi:exosortase O
VSLKPLIENLALLLALGLAHRGGLAWAAEALTQGEGHYHALVGVALLAVLGRRGLVTLGQPLQRHTTPTALLIAATIAAVAAQPLDVGLLEALAAMVAGYGFLGLLLAPAAWRAGRVVFLVALLALPSMAHLQAYIGFPLRLATAGVVAELLTLFGVAHVDLGTVLVIDNQETYVDLPCSGVRSLWSGATFFVAATWIERRRLGAGWLALGLGLAVALILANGARVAALVGLTYGLHLPLAAKVLHAPLGVIGFVVACGLAAGGLRLLPSAATNDSVPTVAMPQLGRLALLAALLLSAAVAREPVVVAAPVMSLPSDMVAIDPSVAERALTGSRGGRIAKARFTEGSLSGDVVMVQSRRWRAQHRPDVCLRAAGAELSSVLPARVGAMPVRLAAAQTPAGPATALWWFQSPDQVTDDHTARIFAGMWDDQPWMLVSMLIDGDLSPDHPDLVRAVERMHTHADQQLRSQP